ncbi:hypothetical protein K0M31_007271 [Melipona bicolor]|uniref:Uncharacterized protein n=1 Tax=Melipona bicolor TaxID=60889 RepID=A0AA40KVN0_9HYME|nr:hypothetical protein K0M31_007271 [Melipona bicolor]
MQLSRDYECFTIFEIDAAIILRTVQFGKNIKSQMEIIVPSSAALSKITRDPAGDYSSFHLYVIDAIARGPNPPQAVGWTRGEAVSGLGKPSERAVARSRLAGIQGRVHSAKAPGSIPAPDF